MRRSSDLRCCTRCWPRGRRRGSEFVAHAHRQELRPRRDGASAWRIDLAFAFGDQAMRPAPLLVVAFVAWAALGVATSFGWLPSHAWPLTGAAIAIAALLDLLRLRRRAPPAILPHMPQAPPTRHERYESGTAACRES